MFSRSFHAVIASEADDKHVGHTRVGQVVGQAGVTDAKGVIKGRVHLEAGLGALVNDAMESGGVELRDEAGACRVLHAVNGPQGRGVSAQRVVGMANGDAGRVGLALGVVAGEGDVAGWMPVAGGDDAGEGEGEELVDWGCDAAAVRDGETAVLGEFVSLKV